VIGLNHCRRKEELIGYQRAFGLYFGCVQPVAEGSKNFRIDVYGEKTTQRYDEFWCNELVVDAVHILEEISQLFRPLNTPRKVYRDNLDEARTDKLFTSIPFSYIAFKASRREEFKYDALSKPFFGLCGIDPSVLGGYHPFRRFFAILYVRRYDHATLHALKQHMRHLNLPSLERYIKDPKSRELEKKIDAVFARQTQSLMEEINNARSEFFEELIARMMRGEEIGGGAGLLIRKTIAYLSNRTDFIDSDISKMAHKVHEALKTDGYRLRENPPGFCIAGESRIALLQAKCAREQMLHPEEAGALTCENCNNDACTRGNLREHYAEHDRLLSVANDARISPSVRLKAKQKATILDEVVIRQEASARRNSALFEELVGSFHERVMGGP
jgi:F0F1-type ATP synthase membrane subunit b/b'